MTWFTPETACSCNCQPPACFPCGLQQLTSVEVTISGIADYLEKRVIAGPGGISYRSYLSGWAALNGTYNVAVDPDTCELYYSQDFPISGYEEESVSGSGVWTGISTGGYTAQFRIQFIGGVIGWQCGIITASGTPNYFGNSNPARTTSFGDVAVWDYCAGSKNRTEIISFFNVTVFQNTIIVPTLV